MRALCLLALIATPALAEPTRDWSAEIAGKGLATTERDIAALSAPTPDDRFALAITRFLDGIEQALAARYAVGQSDALELLPVFRLPLPPNPNPAPFDPALIETTFKAVNHSMDESRAALAGIPQDTDLSLTLRLGDVWFDVNRSGTRDPGEGAGELAGAILSLEPDAAAKLPEVTFDRADAAWLSAYSHLLSATGEAVLAFSPTGPITRVMEGRRDLTDKGVDGPIEIFIGGAPRDAARPNPTDYFAMLLLTLRQTPDPGHIHAARDHLLAMIADNRRFWIELGKETDDRQEWIPNAHQTGALPAPLPPNLGTSWQAVLSDAEMLVKGERLIPYPDPTGGGQVGFDLGAWFDKPSAIDIVEWLHGMGLAPYLRKGPLVSTQNWRAFDDLVAGQGAYFAFWLN